MSPRRKVSLNALAKRIKLLLMDVDGVLTDGHVWLQSWPDGTAHEIKGFSAQDGVRLKMARSVGLHTGIITGRESAANERRARECEIEFVYQKQHDKLPAYEDLLRRTGLRDADVCFIGDDLPDLLLLARVGLAVAVANAVPEVKKAAHYVTRATGGSGAVGEVVELILKAQGKWKEAVRKARA